MNDSDWEGLVVEALSWKTGMIAEGELRRLATDYFAPDVVRDWAEEELRAGYGVHVRDQIVKRARRAMDADGYNYKTYLAHIKEEIERHNLSFTDEKRFPFEAPDFLKGGE